MPSRHLPLVRNLILIGCAVAAIPSARQYLHKFASSDPFTDMRKGATRFTPTYLMRLQGVRLKHYSATQLMTYAHCDTVDLAPDRHRFDLTGVHDALYRGKQGEFRYAADHAVYVDALEDLNATGNVHITNEDMDLKTMALAYNGRTSQLNVLGHVVGTLRGGYLDAVQIHYDMNKGSYMTGPIKWKGVLDKAVPEFRDVELALGQQASTQTASTQKNPAPPPGQEASAPTKDGKPGVPPPPPDEDDKPTVWEIQGDSVQFSGEPDQIATYKKAVATDGDIILIAPTVIHNRKTDVVTASGRIQYFSAKTDMVADDAVIYRKEKRAVFTGHVVMYVKPKKDQDGKPKVEPLPAFQPQNPEQAIGAPPAKVTDEEKQKATQIRDSKTVRDFPAIVISEKIEYFYAKGARRAVITGSPQARQELPKDRWRLIWTNIGYYDGEKETLKMVSSKDKHDTRMKNSLGDDVTGEWMLVSTKEDDDSMQAHDFTGALVQLDNDEFPTDKKPGAANPNAPKPPGTGGAAGTTTQPSTGAPPPSTPPVKPGGG